MINELNIHFDIHNKMYCVFNVLNTDRGRSIEKSMLSWLTTKYDVISIVHDGVDYEYDGLQYLINLSLSSKEPILYLHTKGAVNSCEFANKVINLWKDEFINHYDEYAEFMKTEKSIACPFCGVHKVTWFNGFYMNFGAANLVNKVFHKDENRYYYEVIFQDLDGIDAFGRIYSDVDNDGNNLATESKLKMNRYIMNYENELC